MVKRSGKLASGSAGAGPPELKRTLADINEIARKRFQTDFESLVRDADRKRSAARMRHIVGVALKKEYSDEEEIRNSKGQLIDYKWHINAAKLEALPDTAWQIQLLSSGPARLSGETGKQVAARLRRETLLQRYYFSIVHPYLCQSEVRRKEIKKLLEQIGLGGFAVLAGPKGLAAAGTASLYSYLVLAIPQLSAAAIAITALVLCVNGLDRICDQYGKGIKEPAKKRKARRNKRS